jgi:hypothetical protein
MGKQHRRAIAPSRCRQSTFQGKILTLAQKVDISGRGFRLSGLKELLNSKIQRIRQILILLEQRLFQSFRNGWSFR